MIDKEFLDLEIQVKSLIKLSQQLKEANMNLLKKNSELTIREQKLSEILKTSAKGIEKLISSLREENK